MARIVLDNVSKSFTGPKGEEVRAVNNVSLTVEKTFAGRVPRTEYKLTATGRGALERYVVHMEDLIRMMKGSER